MTTAGYSPHKSRSGSAGRSGSGGRSNARGSSKNTRGTVKEQALEILRESRLVAGDETQRIDQVLLWIIVVLVVVGTLMMFSASYAFALNKYGDSAYYLKKQLIWAGIGFAVMWAVSYIPVRYYKRMTFWLLIVSYVLLIAVFFAPARNDAHRWVLGFQPSELSKFVVILFCSAWADTHSKRMRTFLWGILPFMLVVGSTALLILKEPHISCTVIVLLLCVTIMIVGGMNLKILGVLGGIAGALVAALFIFREGLEEKISIVKRLFSRIDIWLDPFEHPRDGGWQTIQSLYAVSSGGLFGQGIGNSHQKYLYIPEPQNDFIFAVVCEELGFIGAVVILLLFAMLVWRGFSVSINSSNRFSMLMGIGITAQVGWQTLLNMLVVTNCIPNTGISLPFFSYGGSSLVMLMAEMGILLSISRTSSLKR